MTLDELIREHTLRMLTLFDGNRTQTALDLAISVRTLTTWLRKWRSEGHRVIEAKSGFKKL